MFDLVNVAAKTQTHFLKDLSSCIFKLILNKNTFEHSRHYSKARLKVSKHLYTNIFYHVSQQYIDTNWILVTVSSSQSTFLA